MYQIVVGVDESEGSAEALRWAASEATLRAARVTAVMAWGYIDQHHEGDRPDDRTFDPDYHADDARRALEAIVGKVLGPQGAEAVICLPVNDLAPSALLGAAAGADLLVVGARGLGGFRGLLLGSVSQRCVQHAPCPTAVVRPGGAGGDTSRGERIVVGIDSSETARRALHWTLDEGRVRHAAVDVVHSWSHPYLTAYPLSSVVPDPQEAGRRACQVIADALADEDTRDLPVPPRAVPLTGSPARAILDTAEEANLVVVGTRGRGAVASLVLGSVSQQVVVHAPCSVVVVPAGA